MLLKVGVSKQCSVSSSILFITEDEISRDTGFSKGINIPRFHLKCQLMIESILVTSLQPVRSDGQGENGSNFDIGSLPSHVFTRRLL